MSDKNRKNPPQGNPLGTAPVGGLLRKFAVPSIVAMMVVQIVMNNSLTYYGAMSEYGKSVPLACAGLINKVSFIFFAVCIGIAQGMQPISSFNYGAKQFGRVKQVLRYSLF